jgi:hypothetical protein
MRVIADINHTHFIAWDTTCSPLNRPLDRMPIDDLVKRGEAIHCYHEIDENTIQVYLYVNEPLPQPFERFTAIQSVGILKLPSGRMHIASARIEEPKRLKGQVTLEPGTYRVDARWLEDFYLHDLKPGEGEDLKAVLRESDYPRVIVHLHRLTDLEVDANGSGAEIVRRG